MFVERREYNIIKKEGWLKEMRGLPANPPPKRMRKFYPDLKDLSRPRRRWYLEAIKGWLFKSLPKAEIFYFRG